MYEVLVEQPPYRLINQKLLKLGQLQSTPCKKSPRTGMSLLEKSLASTGICDMPWKNWMSLDVELAERIFVKVERVKDCFGRTELKRVKEGKQGNRTTCQCYKLSG